MRQVAHVIRSLDQKHGGPSACVPSLAGATSATGRYSDVLVDFYSAGGRSELADFTIPHLCLPWQPWRLMASYAACPELSSTVRNTDIVHVHGLWQAHSVAAARMSRRFGKPYIVSAHGMLDGWALRNKRWKKAPYSVLIERPNLAGAACLRALTAAEARNYRQFGVRSPIVIVPNGVEVPDHPSPRPFLEQFAGLRGMRLILFLGRVHYKKGLDILLRAWALVRARHSDAHLVIAGPDFEHTQAGLLQQVVLLDLQDSVTFTGMLNSELKWSALAACWAFVLPSYSEGFSVAVLEAMACGRPVIVTHQCNFPEVASWECGWQIEPDAAQLESALRECLRMPEADLARLGQNGRRLVGERYSWPTIGEQMVAVNDWLLGAALPAGV